MWMTRALTAHDPRYQELFDPAKEAANSSGTVLPDLTPAMSAWRERTPVMKGSLRELLGLPELRVGTIRMRTTLCGRDRRISALAKARINVSASTWRGKK
jgi:hypothetical protein